MATKGVCLLEKKKILGALGGLAGRTCFLVLAVFGTTAHGDLPFWEPPEPWTVATKFLPARRVARVAETPRDEYDHESTFPSFYSSAHQLNRCARPVPRKPNRVPRTLSQQTPRGTLTQRGRRRRRRPGRRRRPSESAGSTAPTSRRRRRLRRRPPPRPPPRRLRRRRPRGSRMGSMPGRKAKAISRRRRYHVAEKASDAALAAFFAARFAARAATREEPTRAAQRASV